MIRSAWLWRAEDGPATERIHGALLRLYGAALLLVAASIAVTAPATTGPGSSLVIPLPTLLACVVVAVAISSLLRCFTWVHLLALVVAGPLGLWMHDSTPGQLPVPTVMLEFLGLVGIVVSLRRVPAATVGAVATLTFAGLATWHDPGRSWAWWDMTVVNAGVLAACAAFMDTLTATSRETDRLAAEADAIDTDTRLRSTRSSSANRARGIAHNHAIYALEAIGGGQPHDECVAMASEVTRALSGRQDVVHAPVTVDDLARAISSASPVRLVVASRDGARLPDRMPVQAYAAVCDAAGEALRNVRKHAGVDQARLRIRASHDALDVTISDEGRGLSPTSRVGYGIREAIVGRLEEVGGTATVDSRRSGTDVRLRWSSAYDDPASPRRDLTSTYDTSIDVSDGRKLFGRMGWPLLAVQTYLALRHSVGSDHQAALLTLLVVVVATTVLTIVRLGRGALRASEVVGSGLAAAAITGVGFAGVGLASARDYESWFVGFAAVPLILVAFTTPWRWLVVLALPSAALVPALIAASPSVDLVDTAGCWLTPTGVIAAWVIGVFIRQARADARVGRERVVEMTVAAARLEADLWAAELHLGFARTAVLPFLAAVEAGDLDPTSSSTRRHAATLAAHVRDELVAPGLLDAALRERVARFRSGGGTVTLQHPGAEHAVDTRVVVRLLDRALDLVADDATLTVTVADADGRGRLSISPPPVEVTSLQRGLTGVEHEVRRYPNLVQIWFGVDTPPTGNGVWTAPTVESLHG